MINTTKTSQKCIIFPNHFTRLQIVFWSINHILYVLKFKQDNDPLMKVVLKMSLLTRWRHMDVISGSYENPGLLTSIIMHGEFLDEWRVTTRVWSIFYESLVTSLVWAYPKNHWRYHSMLVWTWVTDDVTRTTLSGPTLLLNMSYHVDLHNLSF